MQNGESTIEDWEILNLKTEDKQSRKESNWFLDVTFILSMWIYIEQVNMKKLRFLNHLVAKILAIYTGNREAKKANSDTVKKLEAQLLLIRKAYIMLIANL
jgi:hypothetical protein